MREINNTTKDHILEKAFILFLKRSYGSVSMDNIQEETNLSRGAIYHHFKGKEEIFAGVINKFFFPALSALNSSDEYLTVDKPLKEALNDVLNIKSNHIKYLREITNTEIEDFYFFRLAFQAEEFYNCFKDKVKKIQNKESLEWLKLLTIAKSKGEIRSDIDVEMTATLFVIVPQGLGLNALFGTGLTVDTVKDIYSRLYKMLI